MGISLCWITFDRIQLLAWNLSSWKTKVRDLFRYHFRRNSWQLVQWDKPKKSFKLIISEMIAKSNKPSTFLSMGWAKDRSLLWSAWKSRPITFKNFPKNPWIRSNSYQKCMPECQKKTWRLYSNQRGNCSRWAR